MSEPVSSKAEQLSGPARSRRWRNFLLDARFQLKAVFFFLALAGPLIALLGGFLWLTSCSLLREADRAVEARSQAAQTSRDLDAALLNNELVKRFDDPSFVNRLREESKRIDERYQAEKDAIVAQHAVLLKHHRVMSWSIFGGLLSLLVLIAVGTVVATHRIVGPVFRLKRLMHQVGAGEITGILNLRKGDELQDLFFEFKRMIGRIHDTQTCAMESLDELTERAGAAHVPADILDGMQKLRTALGEGRLLVPDTEGDDRKNEG